MKTNKEKVAERASTLRRIADILKAIAHPTKLSIIELLGDEKPRCVSEIQEMLNVKQSLLSQHLVKMRDKGILISRREGKHSFYELADRQLLKIFDCMGSCSIV